MLRHGNALVPQTLHDILLGSLVEVTAHRGHMIFMDALADGLHGLKIIEAEPAVENPFRHGIGDGKIGHRHLLRIRIFYLVQISCHTS